jgi:hypothetical protein
MELGDSSGKDVSILFRVKKVFFGANKKVQLFLNEKSRIEALTHCTLMLLPDSYQKLSRAVANPLPPIPALPKYNPPSRYTHPI